MVDWLKLLEKDVQVHPGMLVVWLMVLVVLWVLASVLPLSLRYRGRLATLATGVVFVSAGMAWALGSQPFMPGRGGNACVLATTIAVTVLIIAAVTLWEPKVSKTCQ